MRTVPRDSTIAMLLEPVEACEMTCTLAHTKAMQAVAIDIDGLPQSTGVQLDGVCAA